MRWWFRVLLQAAYSSERGAALAYVGHAAILSGEEHRAVCKVHDDELEHRARLAVILKAEGIPPSRVFETFFLMVGSTIALGCRIWGHWASSLGASWFELHGVLDYEALERASVALGKTEWVEDFREMAAVEEEHRALFQAMSRGESLPEYFNA